MALIKTFDFKTFSKIVFYDKNIFDWKVYSKISHHLSGEIRQFFDEIMLIQYNFKFEENGIEIAFNQLDVYIKNTKSDQEILVKTMDSKEIMQSIKANTVDTKSK
jgi:hypothetical protein